MRKVSIALAALGFLLVALFAVACGENSASPQPEASGPVKVPSHSLAPEMEQKIIDDAVADLKLIAASGKDLSKLPQALTGKALENMENSINADLAQGKYRQRDYQNINVRLSDYTAPLAEIFAEFDDNGVYVDAQTGAVLDQPVREHKTFALALVEEDGRWKIKGIYDAAGTNADAPTT